MTLLEDYLEEAMAAPWQWGEMDCCFFAGNWIKRATGRDPMSTYRGIYTTARGALELMKQRGGLVEMVGSEMERCNFDRVETPDHGDIAVITVPGGCTADYKIAGASVVIRSGPWWMAKGLEGITALRADPLAVWRVA